MYAVSRGAGGNGAGATTGVCFDFLTHGVDRLRMGNADDIQILVDGFKWL